jgi:hypothetical protein
MSTNTYFIGVIISNFEGDLTMENLARALEMTAGELASVMRAEPELRKKFDERSSKLAETNRRARGMLGEGQFMKPMKGFGDRCDRLLMNRQFVRREAAAMKR